MAVNSLQGIERAVDSLVIQFRQRECLLESLCNTDTYSALLFW
jgi:hypothetical protein